VATPSKERISARGKKVNSQAKDKIRRTTRPTKKTDRTTEKRGPRKLSNVKGTPSAPRREEYKPREEKPAGKPTRARQAKVGRTPEAKKTPIADEKQSATGRDRKKSTFGRKHIRPAKTQPKTEESDIKRKKPEPAVPDKLSDLAPAKDGEVKFDVPKFPDTILDDLVSPEDEFDSAKPASNVADEPVPSIEGEDSNKPVSAKGVTSSETEESSTDEKPVEDKSRIEDFSRLDEAILGHSDETEEKPSEVISPAEGDSSPNSSPKESTFVPLDDETLSKIDNGDVQTEPSTSDEDTNEPETEEEVKDASSSNLPEISTIETSPEVAEIGADESGRTEDAPELEPDEGSKVEMSVTEENKPSSEADAEDGVDEAPGTEEPPETKAEENTESNNDEMKWGRPKRKKMSR
jgi:hypothetical protein